MGSPTFGLVARGDDAAASGLPLDVAIAALDLARKLGLKDVSIVDESSGAVLDEEAARGLLVEIP